MKKVICIFALALVMLVTVNGVVLAIPPSPIDIYDMPDPPPIPEECNAYAVWGNSSPDGMTPGAVAWYLWIAEESYSISFRDWATEGRVPSLFGSLDSKVGVLSCASYYNNTKGMWEIDDWGWYVRYPSMGSQNGYGCTLLWNSHDILDNGEVAIPANPFPAPPLIGLETLMVVPQVMGGVSRTIIPVGLVLLSMLLLVALIRYLLRLWTLRIKS